MTMLLQNGWIVPMADSGAEYPDGWVLVRDGLVEALGDGAPPAADSVVALGGAVDRAGLGLGVPSPVSGCVVRCAVALGHRGGL